MIHYYKTHLHLFAKLKAMSCIKSCKIALKNASGTLIVALVCNLLYNRINLVV